MDERQRFYEGLKVVCKVPVITRTRGRWWYERKKSWRLFGRSPSFMAADIPVLVNRIPFLVF